MARYEFDSPYNGSGSLTREQFLFHETRIIARLLYDDELTDDEAVQKVMEENLFHEDMYKRLERYKNMDLHVLDVGSHVGFFSQWIGRKIPNMVFHLFDPHERHCGRAAWLNWNNEHILREPHSRQHLVINTLAVGAEDIKLIKLNVGEAITKGEVKNKQGEIMAEQITIDSYNKDTPCRKYFCLKIDTDGMNLEVLTGAIKTLPMIKWLLIEIEGNYHETHHFLKRHRFEFYGYTSATDEIWHNPFAMDNWVKCLESNSGEPY